MIGATIMEDAAILKSQNGFLMVAHLDPIIIVGNCSGQKIIVYMFARYLRMPRKYRLSLPLFFFLLLLIAFGLGGLPRIKASGATVLEAKLVLRATGGCSFCEAPSANLNSQAALIIRNRGGEADTLLKVETEGAGQVAFSQDG